LETAKSPALAVSHLPNVRYLTGFTGSNGLLLVSGRDAVLFTDPRYELQSQDEVDCKVQVVRGSLWTAVAKTVARRKLTVLGLESEHISYQAWRGFTGEVGSGVRLKGISGLVEGLRSIKDAGEIEAIRLSVLLNSKAYERGLKVIKPGIRERDIAAELDYQMRRLGAEGPAFETIVAAGARSALPHARPTEQPLTGNQLVLVDMGASLNGYASDMTRVVHLGKPARTAERMYKAVLEAQLAAIDKVRAGVPAAKVDHEARITLKRWKLDHTFQHSTGHGLGLEIHEGPRIGKNVETKLEPGMVITIEPGAYVEGFGGVRIEDTVLVTEKGCEVLTPTRKELLVL
jgi:Xaa-Pro aminopeptidase